MGLQSIVWSYFDQLQASASKEGIELLIASGFRDFDRQLRIWNGKANGQRAVLNNSGEKIDISALKPMELAHGILRWSALPGASRHHWGTDLDVYDGATIAADYELQLTPQEYGPNGPFERLNNWLTSLEQEQHRMSFGFFRPYLQDKGGIAPEAWHISYAPIAAQCQQRWGVEELRQCLVSSELALKEELEPELGNLFERYVHVSPELYPSAFRESVL